MTVAAGTSDPGLPRGLRGLATVWFPILGPIGAWTVHALYIAAIARLTCTRPSTFTSIHVVTGVTLGVCAVALVLAVQLARRGGPATGADTTSARARFLGLLGVAVAIFNILLIAAEELFAIGLHMVGCGA